MEGPAAVLAPVELSLLVDGIARRVKRRLPSAFGAADSLALLFFYRILYHFVHFLIVLGCKRQGKYTKNLPFLQEQNALRCIFCKFCQIFVNSATPPLPCTFRPCIKNPPFHREKENEKAEPILLDVSAAGISWGNNVGREIRISLSAYLSAGRAMSAACRSAPTS